MNASKIQEQITNNRRVVSFDSYDITVRQLLEMTAEGLIDIAAEYQRQFVWDTKRQSQLIESIFLGIPIPSLFLATNIDSSWEVIDGVQRLTTIINFIGNDSIIRQINPKGSKLKIDDLEKLNEMNGLTFEDLPKSIQIMFSTRPIRVTVLNDRSDFKVRYDLFERLNTGGVSLQPQEIRNCLYLGEFNNFIKECSKNENFLSIIKIPENSKRTTNLEELVLRFFAYYENRNIFVHSVNDFLSSYMEQKTKNLKNKEELSTIFEQTFKKLKEYLPNGIVRRKRVNSTPIVLYEAIAVGVADILAAGHVISREKLLYLLDDDYLAELTTGATNSKLKVNMRIDFVKKILTPNTLLQ